MIFKRQGNRVLGGVGGGFFEHFFYIGDGLGPVASWISAVATEDCGELHADGFGVEFAGEVDGAGGAGPEGLAEDDGFAGESFGRLGEIDSVGRGGEERYAGC